MHLKTKSALKSEMRRLRKSRTCLLLEKKKLLRGLLVSGAMARETRELVRAQNISRNYSRKSGSGGRNSGGINQISSPGRGIRRDLFSTMAKDRAITEDCAGKLCLR